MSFTLEVEILESDIERLEQTLELLESTNQFEYGVGDAYFSQPTTNGTDGELFYNSMTNKLQKFINGEWIDISGVGGPPSPRR